MCSCIEKLYLLNALFSLVTVITNASGPIQYIFSGVASPKFWEGSNILLLSEQQNFVWDIVSRSTNRQKMLENFGGMDLLAPP